MKETILRVYKCRRDRVARAVVKSVFFAVFFTAGHSDSLLSAAETAKPLSVSGQSGVLRLGAARPRPEGGSLEPVGNGRSR